MTKTEKKALEAAYRADNDLASVGAIVLLRLHGHNASTLIWNGIQWMLSMGILMDAEQIKKKMEASVGADHTFYMLGTDEEIHITSWSNPKAFWAVDKDAAIVFADVLLTQQSPSPSKG